ncbi:MAG: hypothetical protein GY861_28090 [bacterium]|nr:hypothetical protein [bacterium]
METFDVIESKCSCGQKVLIDRDANNGGVRRTCRRDGKRVFYPGEEDKGICVFRCSSCLKPIDETCLEAAHG